MHVIQTPYAQRATNAASSSSRTAPPRQLSPLTIPAYIPPSQMPSAAPSPGPSMRDYTPGPSRSSYPPSDDWRSRSPSSSYEPARINIPNPPRVAGASYSGPGFEQDVRRPRVLSGPGAPAYTPPMSSHGTAPGTRSPGYTPPKYASPTLSMNTPAPAPRPAAYASSSVQPPPVARQPVRENSLQQFARTAELVPPPPSRATHPLYTPLNPGDHRPPPSPGLVLPPLRVRPGDGDDGPLVLPGLVGAPDRRGWPGGYNTQGPSGWA
jgi:hypothetical protein